ncbi:MAG: hypothetical protein WCQ96_02985 [Patescibacteria group bacterium]
MENKTKFAIGDHVRVIESGDTDTQTRTFIGKTVIVTDTANNGKHVICKAEKGIVVFNDSELELIPRTLENLEVGDVVKQLTESNYLMEVLAVLGGVGEKKCYLMSELSKTLDDEALKAADVAWTVFDLKERKYTPYTPEPEKTDREKLVEEFVERWQNENIYVPDFLNDFADKLLK